MTFSIIQRVTISRPESLGVLAISINFTALSKEENRRIAREESSSPLINLPKKGGDEMQKAMEETGPYLTLGIQLAMFIALMAGAGYYVDKLNHSSPLWTGLLSGAGAVMGLTYFIMTALRLSKEEETKKGKK